MINPPVSNQLLFRSRAQDEHVALLRRQRIPAGFVFYDQDMLDVAAVEAAILPPKRHHGPESMGPWLPRVPSVASHK
ncbi:MAG: hypothetical protein AUH28_19355 [Acidobacteria bacterium 13_1_40CM_56_16]|nr:MAG: hypothetical protein AUH28_19355 [Acidobacteria bacterium 13_1_40CM_56_16]